MSASAAVATSTSSLQKRLGNGAAGFGEPLPDPGSNRPLKRITAEDCKPGDIDPKWIPLVEKDINALMGIWELERASCDSAQDVMKLLNIPGIKRSLVDRHKCRVVQLPGPLGLVRWEKARREDPRDEKEKEKDPIVKMPDNCTGPTVYILVHLPMKIKKEGILPTDGTGFEQMDHETDSVWTNLSVWENGRLFQHRSSETKGVMFDTRCAFKEDPRLKEREERLKAKEAEKKRKEEEKQNKDGSDSDSSEESDDEDDEIPPIEGGPVMLFRWTVINKEGKMESCNRWYRKVEGVAEWEENGSSAENEKWDAAEPKKVCGDDDDDFKEALEEQESEGGTENRNSLANKYA